MAEVQTKALRLSPARLKLKDAELEAAASGSLLALMKLRWEQTIGGGGYSFREYARIVERNESNIRSAAKGFALWMEWERDGMSAATGRRTPIDALKLTSVSEPEREAAVVTAEALDTSPAEAVRARRMDVKEAKRAARAVIDQGGTADEAREAAREAATRAQVEEFNRLKEQSRPKDVPTVRDILQPGETPQALMQDLTRYWADANIQKVNTAAYELHTRVRNAGGLILGSMPLDDALRKLSESETLIAEIRAMAQEIKQEAKL